MSIIKRKVRLYCISNIIVTFVCVGLLGTTYCNNQILGQDSLEVAAEEDIPLSQSGDSEKANVDVIEVPDVKELSNASKTTTTKSTTTKKSTTNVVKKKEVKASAKYTPAKYNEVTGSAIVDYAKKYLGLRYVSNGFSLSTGTDCSGFTKLIYREFGITLSRSAKGQASSGSYVRKSDLQKGDLVFYGNGSNTISHVAIYIGGGKVIHESNHRDGVKISSVNMMRYITARRVINSKANEIAAQLKASSEVKEETKTDTQTTETTNSTVVENNNVTANNNVNSETTTTEATKEQVVENNSNVQVNTPQAETSDVSNNTTTTKEETTKVEEPPKVESNTTTKVETETSSEVKEDNN